MPAAVAAACCAASADVSAAAPALLFILPPAGVRGGDCEGERLENDVCGSSSSS